MYCPICNDVRMREVEKDGVLIDICPDCKGVWLDRGELEKLMADVRSERQSYNEWYDHYDHHHDEHHGDHRRDEHHGDHRHYDGKNDPRYKRKKKKSLFDRLEDLFD